MRKFLHRQAGNMGLVSFSIGDGADRCLHVRHGQHHHETSKPQTNIALEHTCPVALTAKNDASYHEDDSRLEELVYGDRVTIIYQSTSKGPTEHDSVPSTSYLTTLQNPLMKTARLVGLDPSKITRPFSMVNVFELTPPSEDVELGQTIFMGKRFKLRHIGTGDFLMFDPSKGDAPVFLQGNDTEGGHEGGQLVRDPRVMLTFVPTRKTDSAMAPVHGNDLVKVVMNDSFLRIEEDPRTKEKRAKYETPEADGESEAVASIGTMFRIQVFQKFSKTSGTGISIGSTTRIFHVEDESYLTGAGSVQQPGGKTLALHKAKNVARGGGAIRNSNRLFTVTNASLSRRHCGGQIRVGDVFQLYNLASGAFSSPLLPLVHNCHRQHHCANAAYVWLDTCADMRTILWHKLTCARFCGQLST
eukprot:SAG11_NODE_452_length_9380_cov_10.655533_2_plen_416_part_00